MVVLKKYLNKPCQMGKPIQLVIKDEQGNFKPNSEELLRVFSRQDIANLPIGVYSVAGKARLGKSFFLNAIMRKFHHLNDYMENGFQSQGGTDSTTAGILIWSEPMIIGKNGNEKAIFLMDTEGSFDKTSNINECALIFMISTILSSLQIYNISKKVDENDLENISLFAEFSQEETMYQELLFLIRDWQCPEEESFGLSGGKMYIDKVLERNVNEKNQTTRDSIRNHFEQTNCLLMPFPGENTKDMKKIKKEFKKQINCFIEEYLTESKARVKRSNKKVVTCTEWLKMYIALFNRIGEMDNVELKGVNMANMEILNQNNMDNMSMELNSRMKELIENEDTWKSFDETSQRLFEEYREKLRDSSKGSEDLKKMNCEKFEKKFEEDRQLYSEILKNKIIAHDRKLIKSEHISFCESVELALFGDKLEYISEEDFEKIWSNKWKNYISTLKNNLIKFDISFEDSEEKTSTQKSPFLVKLKIKNDSIEHINREEADSAIQAFVSQMKSILKVDEFKGNFEEVCTSKIKEAIEMFDKKKLGPANFTSTLEQTLKKELEEQKHNFIYMFKAQKQKSERYNKALSDGIKSIEKNISKQSFDCLQLLGSKSLSIPTQKVLSNLVKEFELDESQAIEAETILKKNELIFISQKMSEEKLKTKQFYEQEIKKMNEIFKNSREKIEFNLAELKEFQNKANELKKSAINAINTKSNISEEDKKKMNDNIENNYEANMVIKATADDKKQQELISEARVFISELVADYSNQYYVWRNPENEILKFTNKFPDLVDLKQELRSQLERNDSNNSMGGIIQLGKGLLEFGVEKIKRIL